MSRAFADMIHSTVKETVTLFGPQEEKDGVGRKTEHHFPALKVCVTVAERVLSKSKWLLGEKLSPLVFFSNGLAECVCPGVVKQFGKVNSWIFNSFFLSSPF